MNAADRPSSITPAETTVTPPLEPGRRRLKNCKAKGSRNERRSIALLEASGYRCTKAAASLGAWDIIGVSSQGLALVQVKSNAWPGSVEMETLREFPAPANALKLVHRWRDRQRMPDVRELKAGAWE